MSQREYAEDTIWWSIKDATTHAPHRRTVVLFHTNTSALRGRPNPLTWVDNTGQVWPELRAVLRDFDPRRIALNTDRNIAFGGGLHVGELEVLKEELGEEWMAKTVNEPMLGIEFVAKRTPGQITYYKLMMETIWAMLEEGFSERTIVVNVTTTVVGPHCLLDANNRSLIDMGLRSRTWNGGSWKRCKHKTSPTGHTPASPSSPPNHSQAGRAPTTSSRKVTSCTSILG